MQKKMFKRLNEWYVLWGTVRGAGLKDMFSRATQKNPCYLFTGNMDLFS